MNRRQPTRIRKIDVTCIECERSYQTTIRVGESLTAGRCPGCACAALLRKWGTK